MNSDYSFRSVFDRTCQNVLQMVMATEMASKTTNEERRRKSESMSTGNKTPPNPTNTRADRRILRSKTTISSFVRCTVTSTEQRKEQTTANEDSPTEKPPDAESRQQSSNHRTDTGQVSDLRQLLLLHLELIQQQQEDIQKKDKDINQLKLEKEQVGNMNNSIYLIHPSFSAGE